ncbi:MAG: nuclear transport factor 2 family protein [Mycobacteriaceae bacterium]|nr:nuclear transport factor 2 family protein [Mycobacteriaceae bacterium]
MSEPYRTAREVAELYTLAVWNERNFDLADALIADTTIRHEVGEAHVLTRAEARKQVEDSCAAFDHLRYDLRLVIADDDGEHVAVVYDGRMSSGGNELQVAGMEVYRVVDGRITEMWNGGVRQGLWL